MAAALGSQPTENLKFEKNYEKIVIYTDRTGGCRLFEE